MATRYWVGGSGSWTDTAKWSTTSGGSGGASVPTIADDVIVNGSSGSPTITLPANKDMKTLTTTGATCTFTSGSALNTYTLNLQGNLTFSSTTTLTYIRPDIQSTATVTTNGVTLSAGFSVEAVGGTVTLGSALTVVGTIFHTAGTFTSNGFNISAGTYSASTISAKTLNLTSTMSLTSSFSAGAATVPLTVNASTGTINLGSNFTGNDKTYGTVNITLDASDTQCFISGANTYSSLTISTTSVVPIVYVSANQTVTGAFSATGSSSANRLRLFSNASSVQRTISVGSKTITNVDFCGINASGGTPWTGTSIGNAGNNSNITFTTAVTRYAVASSTTNYSTIGWSATSGGASGASVPLPQDTVILNASSAAGTYNLDALYCASFTATGFTGTLAGELTGLGNVTLPVSGTTSAFTVVLAGTGTHTYSSNGTIIFYLYVGSTYLTNVGTYSLANNSTTSYQSYFYSGTFSAGVYSFSSGRINAEVNNAGTFPTINMGSNTWYITGGSSEWSIIAGTTLNKQTANISITSIDSPVYFYGGGKAYNKVSFDSGTTASQQFVIYDSNSFTELASTKTVAFTISFGVNQTNTFTAFTVSGSSGNVVAVKSTSTVSSSTTLVKGSPWNIGNNSTVTTSTNITAISGGGIDYLAFTDILGLPAASSFFIMF